jgi:hypothetical protein
MQNGFIERWWNVWGKFGLELAEEKCSSYDLIFISSYWALDSASTGGWIFRIKNASPWQLAWAKRQLREKSRFESVLI